MFRRRDNRQWDQLRPIKFTRNFTKNADGSVLVEFGDTKIFTTAKIEELMFSLKDQCTMVIVTHNMQQAARIADYTAFMYLGKLIEYDETTSLFENPRQELTERYITGKFG